MAVSMRRIGNDSDLDKLLHRVFTSALREGYVEIGPNNHCLPMYFQDIEERVRKFKVQDDDVFVMGQPKTGTTWCHELIWMLLNDLDYEGAKVHTVLRCPLLEMAALGDFKTVGFSGFGEHGPMGLVETLKNPRSIKTHLPWNLMPEQVQNGTTKAKVVLTFRDIKDTCVSNYHQVRATEAYKGTFEEYCELYLGGRAPNTPFWPHVFSLWEQRHRPNVLVVRYEEMKADLPGTIKKMATFLDKTLTDEQFAKLEKHLSFESMKNNSAMDVNTFARQSVDEEYRTSLAEVKFIRAGKVGGHTSLMTPEMAERFNAWIKENTAGTDFPYNILVLLASLRLALLA